MTKNELQMFAKSISDYKDFSITLQTVSGKWYNQQYTNEFTDIEVGKVYGVKINGVFMFDFKTGKNVDNFLKSFINQYVSKYLIKTPQYVDGELTKPTKAECLERLRNNDRVHKSFFYTTIYGIGWFCFLSSDKAFKETNTVMDDYLKSKRISYSNEFSEAGWVYRFVINKDVQTHNDLLDDLTLKTLLSI